jgi:hypothetical protein
MAIKKSQYIVEVSKGNEVKKRLIFFKDINLYRKLTKVGKF